MPESFEQEWKVLADEVNLLRISVYPPVAQLADAVDFPKALTLPTM
jgi:hypothetical protein